MLPLPDPELPDPELLALATSAAASTWAACCCGLPLVSVIPDGVACWVSWSSRLRLLALVSANLDDSATWPLTVAPASLSPFLMPLTTLLGAPGVVTMTTRLLSSRCLSSTGSAAWANWWSPWTCCWRALFWLSAASSLALSALEVRSSAEKAAPRSSVEPSTIPTARARKTATMETRW